MTDKKQIETENTIEAYTFLSRHLLENFPKRFEQIKERTILRHAIEHITGEKMMNPIVKFFRTIF